MKTHALVFIPTLCLLLLTCGDAQGAERLDRSLVAMERPDGSVFLSWRLLADDPQDIGFQILRGERRASVTGFESITGSDSYQLTNCVDKSVNKGKTYIYELYQWSPDATAARSKLLDTVAVSVSGDAKGCLSIPLNGDYDFQKVGIADLDGDGQFEYIIKQPDFNTDPYQQPGYWKPSTTTYKIEAYRANGEMLWRYDMGWSIEAGIWYSPWIVYDLDGDGKAEVYCKAGEGDPRDEKGLVTTGPEYLVKIDGQTGKVIAKRDWLSKDGFDEYNYYQRNFLNIAYLDGKTPSLVMQRGTYKLIKVLAMDKNLEQIWYWDADREQKKYRGQSSHGIVVADVDADGRDELVMGSAVIDDNGKGLWTTQQGHPDFVYVADIDPDNPGLEIFYGIESRRDNNGLCVVDAATGKVLWGHDKPTKHIHGQGMAADILTEYEGIEVYGGERDYQQRWLYSAKGKLIEFHEKTTLTPRALWWDADPRKEVVIGSGVGDWGAEPMQRISGKVVVVVDCVGDYREEIITAARGELRIYTTTIPATDRKVCLMQNHQYRMGVVAQTMGYYYPAQLGP
jgi:rhamnogalacturonan endolyase